MNKELKELLETMNDDEKFEFYQRGVRKRYPIIQKVDQELERVMSFGFEDTPKTLFRFLYLYEPKNISFSDMYKSRLALIRIHEKGVVKLELFKYELAAYLYVTPDQVEPRKRNAVEVVYGGPGIDNEKLIVKSVVYKDFQIFRGLLEMEHDIYDGFIV